MIVLGIVTKWEGKMVLKSALMEGHITVSTMRVYWRQERGQGRLGVVLKSLGKTTPIAKKRLIIY